MKRTFFFNALATHLKRIKNRSAVLGHALVLPALEMPSLCAKVIASRPGLKWKKTSLPCWIHRVGLNDKVSLSLCWSGAIPMEPGLRKKKQKVLVERWSHQMLLKEQQQQSTLGKAGYEGDKGPGSEHKPFGNRGNSIKFRCSESEKWQKWHLRSASVRAVESRVL